MVKRVRLIPLVIMLFCSGISLSSGLFYTNIRGIIYLFPVLFMTGLYFVVKKLFASSERKELKSLLICFIVSVFGLLFLFRQILSGWLDVLNTTTLRLNTCYGTHFSNLHGSNEEYVGLSICHLLILCTMLTIYLYDTKRHQVLIALPSFILFIISIFANGVPYAEAFVSYGIALLVFLGMGRYGENKFRFAVLSICACTTASLAFSFFSWPNVDYFLRQYRTRFLISGNQGTSSENVRLESKKHQKINFGQFNKQGDISFNGTIQLTLFSKESGMTEELFLRGFVGDEFINNKWQGFYVLDKNHQTDLVRNNAPNISIQNQYDNGVAALST